MTEPSSENLARALEEAGAPAEMVRLARADHYHDFKSPLAMPEMQLLNDARKHGLTTIAEGVLEGKWDATKTTRKKGLYRRLTLRRADGEVYLDRWGIGHDRVGGVLLHRMEAPDPGVDLHDHPWTFVSIVLSGGYTELRAETRWAPMYAAIAERYPTSTRGVENRRRVGSIQRMRLDECHTITELHRRRCWTLVIKGPRRRKWGFYMPDGYLDEAKYDATVRADRRDLWSDQNTKARPW